MNAILKNGLGPSDWVVVLDNHPITEGESMDM